MRCVSGGVGMVGWRERKATRTLLLHNEVVFCPHAFVRFPLLLLLSPHYMLVFTIHTDDYRFPPERCRPVSRCFPHFCLTQ